MIFTNQFLKHQQNQKSFCLGLDPTPQILTQWDLPDSLDGLKAFNDIMLPVISGHAGIVKPQAAFYERFGSKGLYELEILIKHAQDHGVSVLLDVKKGDISHTMQAYTEACLSHAYGADAMTVTAYLGIEALLPSFEYAAKQGKGIFVVVLSSNPEGYGLQHAKIDNDDTVAEHVAKVITEFNQSNLNDENLGPIGAVVGATLGEQVTNVIDLLPYSLLLTPGIGAQGATLEDIATHFKGHTHRIIATSSRGVLKAGPNKKALVDALKTQQQALDIINS